MLPQKTVIIVLGPTAVGKTAVAHWLAKYFSTDIISADSRQCYIELNIGVAKPSAAELAEVPHYFINSHSIHNTVNAAVFENYALEKAAAIFKHHDYLVMAGGTGLYLKAFCEGMDEVPVVSPVVTQAIIDNYQTMGLAWLKQEVQQADPLFYATGEIDNPHRLMRALGVYRTTGLSIRSFQTRQSRERPFNIIKMGLELPRDLLYERINQRVESMITEGLVEEAEALLPYQHLNALQTVGYRELFDYFAGNNTLPQAIAAIQLNSRRYAKRQLTWFRKDAAVNWCSPQPADVMRAIKNAGVDPAL